jgi:hypothetical protein
MLGPYAKLSQPDAMTYRLREVSPYFHIGKWKMYREKILYILLQCDGKKWASIVKVGNL